MQNVPTLMQLLVEEYNNRHAEETDSVASFVSFADKYLSANRPSRIGMQDEANCRLTLTNGREVLVSPPLLNPVTDFSPYMPVMGSSPGISRDLPPSNAVPVTG